MKLIDYQNEFNRSESEKYLNEVFKTIEEYKNEEKYLFYKRTNQNVNFHSGLFLISKSL